MKKLLTCAAAIGLAASASAATLDLSTVTTDTTIPNGTTLTGTLNSNVKLTIAAGATVTLSGATINGVNNYDYEWAGLTCVANATIVLQGNNTVKGFYQNYPGIYVPVGNRLIIKGTGVLDASSNGQAAGIGGGYEINCGNIAIESGTITATGGNGSAGIGGGPGAYVGTIDISGGTITATGGRAGIGCGTNGEVCNILISGGSVVATGGNNSAGIGGGYTSRCGGIFISGGTIEANGGSIGPGIGSGGFASCGVIFISGGDVTATAGEGYAAGIGSGEQGSCGLIYIESGITRIIARADDGGVPPIGGAGSSGTCPVVVDDSLYDTTSGSTRTIVSKVVNLANITEATTLADGRILTGTLAANVKVSIADGATVTLRDATINGVKNASYKWAGLTCNGNATIILEGSNTVKGFYEYYPGIYVPEGSTLTIKGDGSLAARSNGYGAGIGGSYNLSCGNIRIEGGTITATGGTAAAGIGGANSVACGYITITGGTIEAMGGARAAGIGSGSGNAASCGDITITKGVTSVTATKGSNAPNSIGAGTSGTCGTVTIGGVVGEITQSPYTYTPNLDLTSVTADMILTDGMTVTGTLAANVKVSIADGATVTLRDVTITGVNNSNYGWAGLTCLGNATIILEGSNTIRGFYEDYPGIYVPVGSTLTIKGDGSLDASSNGWGAGIGGGFTTIACGNIRIEGGTVNATGGSRAAGIGGGYKATCGDITITKGVTSVTAATSGSQPGPYSIGSGISGICGTVTIGGVVTGNISESPYTYTPTRVNLAEQSGNYTAADGEVLYGETAYAVTVPGGASVMINGVEVAGGGGAALPAPTFSADGKAATTEFVQGAGGKWTLTTFAELGNDALGADVANSQIKVYSSSTVEGLESASPMSSGVEVKEKKSAVKTTIEVTPPSGASQFFKVTFGE